MNLRSIKGKHCQVITLLLSHETGDRRQETGDRRQETGDRRQETGDRRQETAKDCKNTEKINELSPCFLLDQSIAS